MADGMDEPMLMTKLWVALVSDDSFGKQTVHDDNALWWVATKYQKLGFFPYNEIVTGGIFLLGVGT